MDAVETWSEFNVAMAGATAALAGLVIVAASVNIGEIVKSRTLTARLGAGIVTLVVAIGVSALGLVPDVDAAWYGILLLLMTVIALVVQAETARLILTDHDPHAKARAGKALLGFLPLGAYVVAGILALLDAPSALYLVAAGSVLAIAAAITVSWVALVEVLR